MLSIPGLSAKTVNMYRLTNHHLWTEQPLHFGEQVKNLREMGLSIA